MKGLVTVKVRQSSGSIKEMGPFDMDDGDSITIKDGSGEEMIWINYEAVGRLAAMCRRIRASFLRKS